MDKSEELGRRRLRVVVPTLLALALSSAAVPLTSNATDTPLPSGAVAGVPPHGDAIVTTKHSITINGRRLNYTARAGLLPLYVDDTGELMANIFFISYTVDRPSGAPPRPLTFLWNGGPGSNAAQVHVVGFGPKRMTTADTYPQWGPDTDTPLVDHPETWLDISDLVFVDPVGTGFSRATTKAYRDILYSSRGDAEAVAEMIRVYLTRFDAWKQPLFIAGESYGTERAMLVSNALEQRRTHLKGVILMSGRLNIGQTVPPTLDEALEVTLYTAVAHYHKRLPADLQVLPEDQAVRQATDWARSSYAPALGNLGRLSAAEREQVLADLQRYTGVSSKYVDQKTLILAKSDFFDHLLEDRGLEAGRYDGRMVKSARPKGEPWLTWIDPSLMPMMDLMEGTSRVFNSYVRHDLGFESDLLYRGPFGRAFHPEPLTIDPETGFASDWMSKMWDWKQSPEPGAPPLQTAMTLNPRLLVWNIKGRYDGSCATLDEAIASAPSEVRTRVSVSCVAGGHMFYSDTTIRRDVKREFADFVRRATAP